MIDGKSVVRRSEWIWRGGYRWSARSGDEPRLRILLQVLVHTNICMSRYEEVWMDLWMGMPSNWRPGQCDRDQYIHTRDE